MLSAWPAGTQNLYSLKKRHGGIQAYVARERKWLRDESAEVKDQIAALPPDRMNLWDVLSADFKKRPPSVRGRSNIWLNNTRSASRWIAGKQTVPLEPEAPKLSSLSAGAAPAGSAGWPGACTVEWRRIRVRLPWAVGARNEPVGSTITWREGWLCGVTGSGGPITPRIVSAVR